MYRYTPLVLFQESPEDSKPWLVARLSDNPRALVDLAWYAHEAEARAEAHHREHGSNR